MQLDHLHSTKYNEQYIDHFPLRQKKKEKENISTLGKRE